MGEWKEGCGKSHPYITSLPPYTGSTFVPVLNNDIPDYLDPKQQTLPNEFVVVITGASRGIGAATAQAFAQAGASGLVLTARSVDSLTETRTKCLAQAANSGLKITSLAADNAKESSAEAVAAAIAKEHGGHLDLLINNAGILGTDETMFGKLADTSSDNVESTINTNYLGRFYMTKHLIPFLQATTGGAQAIVNISSLGSHVSGPFGFSISALATNRLSQRIAEAYEEDGIVSFAVHPGAVKPEVEPAGFPPAMRDFSTTSIGLCGAWLIWLVKEKKMWLNGRYLDVTWDPIELEKKRDEIVSGDKLKMRLVV